MQVQTVLVIHPLTGAGLYYILNMMMLPDQQMEDVDEVPNRSLDELGLLIAVNIKDIVYISGSDDLCRYCSPSVREVLGYPNPEEDSASRSAPGHYRSYSQCPEGGPREMSGSGNG
ncbi:hypothetical protein [Paenibacillus donghaensis]|uniref:hypothetical protein n=1 Tax=Paenibacillus donghaensis TaxID=414771 RepID=UPI001471BF11|nr:hypothetical protein [Paenibacillus donghaensis]